MKPRRVVEEVLVPAQIVAPQPATVTQRNCLECFGLTKADFLRLAGRAFPVRIEGQLRIAKFADVEAYLTTGARLRPGAKRAPAPKPADPLASLDVRGTLHKLGFRPRKP